MNRELGALALLRLDPDFSMAHLYLARANYQLGRTREFREQLALARKGIEHVSERERFLILAQDFAAHSLDEKSLEQYRLLTELYPDDIEGLQGFADESILVGRRQDAIDAEKHVLQINPHSVMDYNRLISWLDDAGQFSSALQIFSSASSNSVKAAELHWGAGMAYLGEDNSEKAREQFQLLAQEGGDYEKGLAALSSARVLIYQGRLREATDALRSGLLLADKQHSDSWIPVYRYLLADVLLRRGQVSDLHSESQRLTASIPQPETADEEARRAGLIALSAGDIPAAQSLLTRLQKLNDTQDSGYTHACYYNLKGAVELAQGKLADAEESQRRAAVYYPLFSAYQKLGDTLAAQHRWNDAVQAHRHFLDFKGELIRNDSPADWVVGNVHLARALAESGDKKESLRYYNNFLRVWANADSDLPIVQQARAERAKLFPCGACESLSTTQGGTMPDGSPAKAQGKPTHDQRQHILDHHLGIAIVNNRVQLSYVQSCGDQNCTLPHEITVLMCRQPPCPG
jgi:tetratricopeptide (TPR) repeat protein